MFGINKIRKPNKVTTITQFIRMMRHEMGRREIEKDRETKWNAQEYEIIDDSNRTEPNGKKNDDKTKQHQQ